MNIIDRFRLDQRVVVVSGGSGLYGLPFCRALADAGATVVVTSRDLERAQTTAAGLGERAVGLRLDQGDPASIEELTDTVLERFQGIDVLVNNAVHRQGGDLDHTSAADWDATSAVNSRGLFLLTQRIAASMSDRGEGGSIVNIGSIYGLVAPDFTTYEGTDIISPVFYAYDKAGMVGFTRYVASALGPVGIRVNCLCLGGLRQPRTDERFAEQYAARTPLGRMAEETDAVGALIFLASDASRYVTGTTLTVDGGWTIT